MVAGMHRLYATSEQSTTSRPASKRELARPSRTNDGIVVKRIVPAIILAAALVVALLLWPQGREEPGQASHVNSDTDVEGAEGVLEPEDNRSARELSLDAGIEVGLATQVPTPEHRAPEELRGVEEAARDALAERQLEHLRTMAELAEQGSDPDRARVMRARIEALEEARRAANAEE